MAGVSAPYRLLVLVALSVLPWTVLLGGGTFTVVFPFGLLNANPLHLTNLYDYLRFTDGFAALPGFLQAWPVSVLCYLGALGSAIAGVLGREDPRVTGGLLTLAALSHAGLAVGLSRGVGRLAVPVGTVMLLTTAWWLYWPAIRGQP